MKTWSKRFIYFLFLLIAGIYIILVEPDLSVEDATEILADEQSKYIDVMDMKVHYKSEGNGFPIVLIHGTSATLHTWNGWTTELSKQYRVIRMDIPAFGLTGPHPDHDYSINAYVDFIDAFTEAVGIDSFHLGGNSLGGCISWNYAAQHPEKIAKLILSAPAGFRSPDKKGTLAFTLAENKLSGKLVEKLSTTKMVTQGLKDVYYDDSKITEDIIQIYLTAAKRKGNRTAFIKRIQQTKESNEEDLKEITAPTLLLWGDDDYLVPHTLAPVFQEGISNNSLIMYPNMGHIPMEEIPVQTVADVLNFLN